MSEVKKNLLKKIESLINKRSEDLLSRFPYVHEIDDGIIIRFFNNWSEFGTNPEIKYRKIINEENPEDITVFWFLPKGNEFSLELKNNIGCISCLSGELEITVNNEVRNLMPFKKICLNTNEFRGKAICDTYILTSNQKSPLC